MEDASKADGASKPCCANCGKKNGGNIRLQTCAACKEVNYCGRKCQLAHHPSHKKRCQQLRDEALFKTIPKEDCPICCYRLPYEKVGYSTTYMPCCGKNICSACRFACIPECGHECCVYCRTNILDRDEKEEIRWLEKRVQMNDSNAMVTLGNEYFKGNIDAGIERNVDMALKLWQRADELGNPGAGYRIGMDIPLSFKKQKYYFQQAAILGNQFAHSALGEMEAMSSNFERSFRHCDIAAEAGSIESFLNLKPVLEKYGKVTKQQCEHVLGLYQQYLKEIKSDHRDEMDKQMKDSNIDYK